MSAISNGVELGFKTVLISMFIPLYLQVFFIIINMGVRANLRVPRLISRTLKLTTI